MAKDYLLGTKVQSGWVRKGHRQFQRSQIKFREVDAGQILILSDKLAGNFDPRIRRTTTQHKIKTKKRK